MKTDKLRKINYIMIGKIAGAAILSALLGMLLLVLTGLIPQSAIEESCRESGAYFKEHELFPLLIEGQFNTRQDNYADCILVNIMYHISGEELPVSLIKASYYNPELESVEVSLWESLQEVKEPNIDYFRYWHGGMVLLRPLFLFTGIEGARLILGGVLLLLTLFNVMLLWKQHAKSLAVCYLMGNCIVQFWMCAFCIEYITTFLVMNVVMAVCIRFFKRREDTKALYGKMFVLSAVSGVWTCFFDFLTTETLAITIPLLMLLVLRYEAGELENFGKELKRIVCCGMLWGVSYGVMFVFKWLLAAGTLGWQAINSALQSAGERIGGTVYLGDTNLDPEASGMQRFIGAILRNQGSLFPFRNEMQLGAAMGCFLGVVLLCFAIVYMLRGRNYSGTMILLCILLGLVPYLRYTVLENHAYLHYFFTYRAQLVTITALLFITYEFGLKNLRKSPSKQK